MKQLFTSAMLIWLIEMSCLVSYAENSRPDITTFNTRRSKAADWSAQSVLIKSDTNGSPAGATGSKPAAATQGSLKVNQVNTDSSSGSGSVDFFYKLSDFSGDGVSGSPFELSSTGVTAGIYTIGSASITVDSKGRITAITMNGSSVPVAASLTADDIANTLQAFHALGASEIMVSVNDSAFSSYDGAVIIVGNVARAEGYWKFKIKAAPGRAESAVVSSPAFTYIPSSAGKQPENISVTATILYGQKGNDFVESPVHTYSSNKQDVVFLTNKALPENTDGIVYTSYPSTASSIIFMGLDETQDTYNRTFSVYANIFTGTYYYVEGQSNIDTGVPLVADANARFGIRRKGSVLTEVVSNDGGLTWKDIHTFNGTTSKALYVKFFNFKAGNTIVDPKMQLP